jgi:excisionase family DNA binding protein
MGDTRANSITPEKCSYKAQEIANLLPSLEITAEEYVDPEHAAKYLSIRSKKLLSLARSGRIPAHGIGDSQRKMWRFRLSELHHWMQTETQTTKKECISSVDRANMPSGSPR